MTKKALSLNWNNKTNVIVLKRCHADEHRK